jgi:hypothetical protein
MSMRVGVWKCGMTYPVAVPDGLVVQLLHLAQLALLLKGDRPTKDRSEDT